MGRASQLNYDRRKELQAKTSEAFIKTENSVSFYIVAHQDDWQLFMTPDAYTDLTRPDTKVVFIYTTAGEAGKDSDYWSAREKGALRSVQYALDTHKSPPTKPADSQKSVEGHAIQYCEYKNSASYFLRLPDGRLTGKGSETYDQESITKLHRGTIESISAVDKSTTYHSWDDLCQTLASIIQTEAQDCTNVTVHSSDFLVLNNLIDNADHLTTGVATKTAVEKLGKNYPVILYMDYGTDWLPPNLTPKQVMLKTGLFTAYDITVESEADHCTHCETDYYLKWCLRQHSRLLGDKHLLPRPGFHLFRLLSHFNRRQGVDENPTRH